MAVKEIGSSNDCVFLTSVECGPGLRAPFTARCGLDDGIVIRCSRSHRTSGRDSKRWKKWRLVSGFAK